MSRSEPIDSRFALLLEDFSPAGGWRQDRLLGPAAARATLAAFARLQGFFWQGSAFWRRGGEEVADIRTFLVYDLALTFAYRRPPYLKI